MDQTLLEVLDADVEAFRRTLRSRLRRALRQSIGEGVGSPAFHIVEALERSGPLSPSLLAATLQVRTSTMAAHLDRLEHLGWVQREAAPHGARRVRVRVTGAGREAIGRYVALRRGVLGDLLDPLSAEDLSALARALRTLVRADLPSEARKEAP